MVMMMQKDLISVIICLYILEADDYKTHHCHTLYVVELLWAIISFSSLAFPLGILYFLCALGQSHVGYVCENA